MCVGLTGGVASGKSAVAAEFERLGAVVVDYDDLMREILVPGHPAVDELRDVFTADVVADDGTVDWLALDALTAESPSARTRLHEVVAPVVRAEADRRATDAGESSVLVVDLALLVDAADVRDFDQVLEVLAPAEVRVARLMDERGLDREQAWAEVDADEQRRPAAGGGGRGWRPGAGSPYRRDRVPDGTRPSARPLDRPPRSVGDHVQGDS